MVTFLVANLLKELLTEEEKEIIGKIESKNDKRVGGSWRGWIPLAWSTKLLNEMHREKIIGICNFITILGMSFKADRLCSFCR